MIGSYMTIFARNKRAAFDYDIKDKLEAGIALSGFEVKAVRAGKASLRGALVIIRNNQAWLINCAIAPYQKNPSFPYDSGRNRQLLLHKKQIGYLAGKQAEHLTLLPFLMYTNEHNKIKLEIAVGKIRTKYNKKERLKEKAVRRETRLFKP